MAKAGEQFGKAILVLEADDTQLRSTLKRDEALVRNSATTMQASLRPLTIGVGALGETSAAASSGVAVLGAAASVSGSTALVMGAQVGQLGVALVQQTLAAGKAADAIKSMTAASLKFLATPLGIVLAALAVVITVATFAWSKYNKEAKEAAETAKAAAQAFKERAASIEKETEALRRKLAVTKGADPRSFAEFDLGNELREARNESRRAAESKAPFSESRQRSAARTVEQLEVQLRITKAIIVAEDKAVDAVKQRARATRLVAEEAARDEAKEAVRQARQDVINNLIGQTQVLRGTRTEHSLVEDVLVRQLTIMRDQALEAKSIADAFAARVGPQTPGAAADLITGELKVLDAQKKRNSLLERELSLRLAVGRITQKQFDTLTKQFGLQQAQLGGGAVQLQTFKRVSLSQTALGGPGSQKAQPVEDKKAIRGLARIERAVKSPQPARAA